MLLLSYISPNAQMIINDKVVAAGYQGFYQHLKCMLGKTTQFTFIFPESAFILEIIGSLLSTQ